MNSPATIEYAPQVDMDCFGLCMAGADVICTAASLACTIGAPVCYAACLAAAAGAGYLSCPELYD
jgi:hypothetical protein